uniref:Uncharacterized protein n=1 Tax=Oryza punctata TaxID=4537 RepID=A0A0E0KML3_ORYPU
MARRPARRCCMSHGAEPWYRDVQRREEKLARTYGRSSACPVTAADHTTSTLVSQRVGEVVRLLVRHHVDIASHCHSRQSHGPCLPLGGGLGSEASIGDDANVTPSQKERRTPMREGVGRLVSSLHLPGGHR